MRTVYLISGLGADSRMFKFLEFPANLQLHHLEWIAPEHPCEPLHRYAERLKEQITDPNPILVGLSYGGMAAIELAKILQPHQVIIISSLATRHALPWYYRLLGKTRFHRWLPFKLMQQTYPLAPIFFGAITRYEKQLLRDIFRTIDETYLRWALEQLIRWPQTEVIPGLIHIHGTADLVLPLHDREKLLKVPGGKHLMVMNRAEEISAILAEILKTHEHE
ncbi:alpha/beta fold hydrolase [Pontibacter sp. CAU 1760]